MSINVTAVYIIIVVFPITSAGVIRWINIDERVMQTANVIKFLPEQSSDDMRTMLAKLTVSDPDSQDIYMAFGDRNEFS